MEKQVQTGTLDATLGELAEQLAGEVVGEKDFRVRRLASADSSDPEGLAFAEKQRYVKLAKASGVGALLIGAGIDPEGIPAIRVFNPRIAFFMLLTQTDRPFAIDSGIHPAATVHAGATVEAGADIGPHAVIAEGAVIRRGAKIHAGAYIGEGCEVKSEAVVLPNAVLLRNVELGSRSVVFPCAVLGADGFGFVWNGQQRVKIPQVGSVRIGEDCEIGALSAVDRATAGVTTLGKGTKLDNLVQIGHNVKIGDHVVAAAASAIGGSSEVGNRAVLGGGTQISDHVTVTSDVTLAGRAGVAADIPVSGVYLDFPAHPALAARKNMIHRTKLDDLVKRVRALERKLAQLTEADS